MLEIKIDPNRGVQVFHNDLLLATFSTLTAAEEFSRITQAHLETLLKTAV